MIKRALTDFAMKKMYGRIVSILVVFFALGLFLTTASHVLADTNTTDFESFALGDVNGQNGWTSGHGSSTCPVYDVGVVSNTYGYTSFGAQSLRISNAITCGSFNDMTFSKSLTNEAGETSAPASTFSGGTRQPYFEAQWDFASTVPGAEQSGLSVVASPNRGDTMRMSWLQMQDTPTGLQLNFEDYRHSLLDFVTTPIATGLDRTVTHKVKMTMQLIDGASNDIVKIYLDGSLIYTGTSWEDYYRDFAGGVPFSVDSIMFRTAGTAAPATMGKGFVIDNFSSFSGQVPVVSATLHVVKHVVNNNVGTAVAANFSIHVQQNGNEVVGSPAPGQELPGDPYTLTPNTYIVSEDTNAFYAHSFSGDCDANGVILLLPGGDKTCTITNVAAPAPSSGSGLPPGTFTQPVPPSGGFGVIINDGATSTTNSVVDLKFNTSADIARMAISNSMDFSGIGQEPYMTSRTWTLTPGSGQKNVYVIFYTQSGQTSPIIQGTINLIAPSTSTPTIPAPTAGTPSTSIPTTIANQQVLTIVANLTVGSRGSSIKNLQQFLISQNTGPAARNLARVGATGYFGVLTRAALAEFQAKVGIRPSLGYFGPITRAYLQAHYQ